MDIFQNEATSEKKREGQASLTIQSESENMPAPFFLGYYVYYDVNNGNYAGYERVGFGPTSGHSLGGNTTRVPLPGLESNNPILLSDADIDTIMNGIRNTLRIWPDKMTLKEYVYLMSNFDTPYYYAPKHDTWYKYVGFNYPEINGLTMQGHDLNYMAVGAGFAEYGFSLETAGMADSTWKAYTYGQASTSWNTYAATAAGYNHL